MTVNIFIIIEVAHKYTHNEIQKKLCYVPLCSVCLHDDDEDDDDDDDDDDFDDEACNTLKQ